MFIKRLTIFCFLLSASFAQAEIMSEQPQQSVRVYINSAHLETPSGDRAQHYGASLLYGAPVPDFYGFEHFTSFGLLMNLNPDTTKKSGEVNILEHFYSLSAYLRFDFVKLFRFSALVGPGLLLARTNYNVLNTVATHTEISTLLSGGLAIDYAITEQWEFGWLFQVQYRLAYQKLDWYNGLGVSFNF